MIFFSSFQTAMISYAVISLNNDLSIGINDKAFKRGFFIVDLNSFFTLYNLENALSALQLATGRHKYSLYATSTLGKTELSLLSRII